ncbi:MAG: hypothetical protein LBJ99_02205 [Oscillospiraceae bacterium]|jgi:ribosomal protein L7Ae-like RNA K-turn-binding protein|nr:hypothetical protein [Oscillospiraceae bacterium]
MDNNLALLGIAKKAGLLAEGGELVSVAARDKKARVILSASDASDRSKRRAERLAAESGASRVELRFTKAELGAALGKGSPGMIAVNDAGLAAKLVSLLAPDGPAEPPDAKENTAEHSARRAAPTSGERGRAQ